MFFKYAYIFSNIIIFTVKYNLLSCYVIYFADLINLTAPYRTFDFLSHGRFRTLLHFECNQIKIFISVVVIVSRCDERIWRGDMELRDHETGWFNDLSEGLPGCRSVFCLKADAVTRCLPSFTFNTRCNGVNHHEVILLPCRIIRTVHLGTRTQDSSYTCHWHWQHEFRECNR